MSRTLFISIPFGYASGSIMSTGNTWGGVALLIGTIALTTILRDLIDRSRDGTGH